MKEVKVTLHGRVYDMEKLVDATSIQAELVPDNWPGTKADCVRLMMATQDILCHELRRHIAHNWRHACKTIQENKADGEGASLKLTFKFELDQSVPTLAAIRSNALSYSANYGSTAKAKSFDITQGDFFGDLSATVDATSLDQEAQATAADKEQARLDKEAAAELDRKAEEEKAAGKVTPLPGAKKEKVNQPGGEKPKRVRNPKKKVAAPATGGEK